MATNINNFYRRLDRARKHLEDLERQSVPYLNGIRKKMVTEKDSDGINQLLQIKVKGVKEPPYRLSFIVGDCIHNLRSILDNLVWQLGVASGCPKKVMDKLKFPVCNCDAEFDGLVTKLKSLNGFPQRAIDLIRDLQPYQPYKGRKGLL